MLSQPCHPGQLFKSREHRDQTLLFGVLPIAHGELASGLCAAPYRLLPLSPLCPGLLKYLLTGLFSCTPPPLPGGSPHAGQRALVINVRPPASSTRRVAGLLKCFRRHLHDADSVSRGHWRDAGEEQGCSSPGGACCSPQAPCGRARLSRSRCLSPAPAMRRGPQHPAATS